MVKIDKLIKTQAVFDKSKINSGSTIEITGDSLHNDLIRREAVVTIVELDRIEFVFVDSETKEMTVDHLYIHELTSDTEDGWSIKVIK